MFFLDEIDNVFSNSGGRRGLSNDAWDRMRRIAIQTGSTHPKIELLIKSRL